MVFFYDCDAPEPEIKQFFKLRGIEYDEKAKTVIVPMKCKWITNMNKCKLYSWRPYSCRVYECQKLKELPELHY